MSADVRRSRADAKVPTELKLALQKARNAKGISQKQLATVRSGRAHVGRGAAGTERTWMSIVIRLRACFWQQLNMQPQVVNEYESGKAIPNNAIVAKFEKALGCKLPRVAKVKKSAD